MNLHKLLSDREQEGRPIRVGLIGAGRYGTMYLAQANNIPGIHVVAIADINVKRAEGAFDTRRLAQRPDRSGHRHRPQGPLHDDRGQRGRAL